MSPKKRVEQYKIYMTEEFFLGQILDRIERIESEIAEEISANKIFISFVPGLRENYQLSIDCILSIKDTIRSIEELRKSKSSSPIPAAHSSVIIRLSQFPDDRSKILANILQYLRVFLNIHNGNIQFSIMKPKIANPYLDLFYSFLLYFNCRRNGHYNRRDLEKLLELADSDKRGFTLMKPINPSSLQEERFYPVVDAILDLLNSEYVTPNFYIDDSMLENISRILEGYGGKDYSRLINLGIVRARSLFMDNRIYKHPIYELAASTQRSLGTLPSILTDASEIQDWPSIDLIAPGYKAETLSIKLLINDLVKFQAHLAGSSSFRFSLAISGLTEEENNKLCDSLIRHFLDLKIAGKNYNFFGSAGSVRLPILLKHKPHNPKKIDPKLLAEQLALFVDNYCKEHHPGILINLEQLGSFLLEYFRDFAKNYGLMSFGDDGRTGLALFEPIKALKLFYQTLSSKPGHLDCKAVTQKILPCLWQEQIDKVLEVLGYTLKVALRVKVISEESDFKNTLYDKAKKIIDEKIKLGHSVILQTGIPKLSHASDEVGHTFYVVLQSFEENMLKIIVVDGGDREKPDPQYDRVDIGLGERILCEETVKFELNDSNTEFLRNYIFKILMLRHEACDDQSKRKELLKNIKLRNPILVGKDDINLTGLPAMESEESSHSMASQNFEDCTISNLKEAFRVLFNWSSAEMAHFTSDAIFRYNFLLFQNNHLIDHITQQSKKMLEEETVKIYQDATKNFLEEHYNGHGHNI